MPYLSKFQEETEFIEGSKCRRGGNSHSQKCFNLTGLRSIKRLGANEALVKDISGEILHSFTRGNYWIKRKAKKKKSNAQFKERKKQVFIHRWSSKSFKSVKYFKMDLNSNRKNSMAYVAVSYQKL